MTADTISRIRYGVAAGWRVVTFADGTEKRMSTTEIIRRYNRDPFTNVEPLQYPS